MPTWSVKEDKVIFKYCKRFRFVVNKDNVEYMMTKIKNRNYNAIRARMSHYKYIKNPNNTKWKPPKQCIEIYYSSSSHLYLFWFIIGIMICVYTNL